MFVPEFVKKLNTRFFEKYGTNSYFKTEDFKKSLSYNPIGNDYFRKSLMIYNHPDYLEYLGNEESKFLCEKGHNFVINSVNFHNRIRSYKNICTVCNPIEDIKRSISEKEVCDFIESIYSGETIQSYRDGLEIDIYLPELKIGFEFNGLYWHSNIYKDKNYHLNKTNYFKEKGIRIIHIWEDDWEYKPDILKSQIKNWIGVKSDTIYARKCEIREINNVELYRDFLKNNHIQGYVRSSIKLGIFYNNELVSLMTFDNSEGRKKMEDGGWNLSRFCNKLNTNVIGSASKLLKYFIKRYNPKRIISFADMDWSLGDLYYKLGFDLVKILNPDYKYLLESKRVNKQRFTKSKLIKSGFNEGTENLITEKLGILKIYNVGQMKFQLFII
jgi:hypothetical protein